MRGAPRTVLSCAAAIAASALAFVLSTPGVRDGRARVVVAGGDPAGSPAVLHAPAVTAKDPARSESRASPPVAVPCAAQRAVDELATLLRGVGFDPHAFERGVGALAAELGAGEARVLAKRLADPSGSDEHFAAAAVLLRALVLRGLAVPDAPRPALERLGTLALTPGNGALGEAAASALARLGTARQRRALFDVVLVADGDERERAARALRHAPAGELALELAWTQLPTGVPRTDELLVLAARGLLQDEGAGIGVQEREALRTMLATLDEHGSGGAARARARVALDEGPSEDVVLAALLGGDADPDQRSAAARVVAAEPSHAPTPAREEAASVLSDEARSSDPATRRSALYALASLGEPRGLRELLTATRDDPDPAVRAAALRALRALPAGERQAALEESARVDDSAAVRALARSELRRAVPAGL